MISVAGLRATSGEPDRIVQLANADRAGSGLRWEYDRHGKTVPFTVTVGRVTAADAAR